MTVKDYELRGWREIKNYLGVKDKSTAKKILKARKLLVYENGHPVLNKKAYEISSLKNHEIE